MTQPLVSIIIPLYNAEKYIQATIQSAIGQTWPNKEIIIIDDGSTDKSLMLAKAYENDYIHVFSQANKGASAARNYGLKKATGEYIQFLDADDLLSITKIEDQVNLLIKHPDYICTCPTVHFFDDEDITKKEIDHNWTQEGSSNPIDFLIKLYGGDLVGVDYGGMIAVHSWLSSRHILDKAGPWSEELSVDDDGEYFCRVVLACSGIMYAENSISFYRKYCEGNSLSAEKSYKGFKSILDSTKLKATQLLLNTDEPVVKTVLSRLFHDNAFNFYPKYMDLFQEAQLLANKFDPHLKPVVYKTFPGKYISYIFGWKVMKRLSVFKNNGSWKKYN